MTTPDLSIIICCRNEEEFLPQCLKSLNLEAHPTWEAVVVDDQSTDKSGQIIDFFASKFADGQSGGILRAAHLDTNVGLGMARNHGMLLARGRYACFLDADDYVVPQALEANLALAMGHNADVVAAPHQRLEPEGTVQVSIMQGAFSGKESLPLYLARQFGSWSACFSVVRRAMLLENGCQFTPRMFYEDVAYSLRMHHGAKIVLTSNQAHYVYRRDTGGSITRSTAPTPLHLMSSARLYFDICTFLATIPDAPGLNPAFEAASAILIQDHLPRMVPLLNAGAHRQSMAFFREFSHYMQCRPSAFSQMVFQAAAGGTPGALKGQAGAGR